MDMGFRAVDAYTENNRVVGNTLLAEARQHSSAVQERLAELSADLHRQALAARERAVAGATTATRTAIVIVLVVIVLGILAALAVFRSIVVPLRTLDTAMGGLIEGRHNVPLPPVGRDEVGRMAQTLRLLKESNTTRDRLQSETDEQRRTIETAIETISEGFLLFDDNDCLVVANSRYRALFPGIADLLVPGKPFREIVAAIVERGIADLGGLPAATWVERRVQQHLDPKGAFEQHYAGGVWVRISEQRTPDGGIVGVFTDITDIKRREAQLEEARQQADSANQAKSRFVANMSHELRTPLNAIIGYSEMLIEESAELQQTELASDLGKISGAGKHLLELINDILDLSKIEAGRMELLIETIDVAALISDVQSTMAPLVTKNHNVLKVATDSDLGTMRSDQSKIRQCLFNLLSNAAKFTKDGTIALTAERLAGPHGDRIRFSVGDSGIGMTPEQISHLFQAFSQGDAETTRNYGGTGLGLAITRHFSRMLGGDVSVESEFGTGSTFRITLPVVVEASEPQPRQEHEEEQTPIVPIGEARGLVLVIDDERPARELIRKSLVAEGYAVITASGGQSGLKLARDHRPDLIILDIIMPDMDGWAVLRGLKADHDLADIPVILVTMLSDRDLGLALGAADHLTKPVSTRELTRVLRRVRHSADGSDILIVDDDAGTRDVLRRTLLREGWSVREAENGVDGLAQLAEAKPAVVLLDLMMPKMPGFEMLRAMRENDEWHDVPVVVVTSKDLGRDELKWLHANTVDVFQKGVYARDELVAALRDMVRTAHREDHPTKVIVRSG